MTSRFIFIALYAALWVAPLMVWNNTLASHGLDAGYQSSSMHHFVSHEAIPSVPLDKHGNAEHEYPDTVGQHGSGGPVAVFRGPGKIYSTEKQHRDQFQTQSKLSGPARTELEFQHGVHALDSIGGEFKPDINIQTQN